MGAEKLPGASPDDFADIATLGALSLEGGAGGRDGNRQVAEREDGGGKGRAEQGERGKKQETRNKKVAFNYGERCSP